MASKKATFTLDPETIRVLNDAADRLQRSKSEVVREAIRDYGDRVGQLSERERRRLLARFDDLVPRIPSRPVGEVEAELRALRAARHGGGRGGQRRRP